MSMKSITKILLVIFAIFGLYLMSNWIFPNIVIPDEELSRNLEYLKFNSPQRIRFQKIAFTIFLTTVIGTIFFWRYRVAIVSVGIGVVLLSGVMDIETTIKFMSIPTMLFIVSMMAIVGWLEKKV